MKALSRRKTDPKLIKVLSENQDYNAKVKKTLLGKIGSKMKNIINETPR